jgi:hypothetical protein
MEKQMTKYRTLVNHDHKWEELVVPAVVVGIFIIPPTFNLMSAYLNNRTAKVYYATELLRKTSMVAVR